VDVIKSNLVHDDKDDEIDDETLQTWQIVNDWHRVGKFLHEITGDEERDGNGPLIDQHHTYRLDIKFEFSIRDNLNYFKYFIPL